MRALNLTGMRFGRWLVGKRAPNTPKEGSRWYVRCDCGNEKIVSGGSLQQGASQSCGCLNKERTSESRRLKTGNAARNRVLKIYKDDANARHFSWNISDSQFDPLVLSPCHYCGRSPGRIVTWGRGVFVCNGIDRLDSRVGYEENNVVPCCEICNRMKGTLTLEKFLERIKEIHTRHG